MKNTMFKLVASLLALASVWAQGALAAQLDTRDVHIDAPLSNVAVQAYKDGDFVGAALFPAVPVINQSDGYWVIDKSDWMRNPGSTLRSPKTSPRRVSWSVSTDTYSAKNFALAVENPWETLANAAQALRVRTNSVRKNMADLMRDMEFRIASRVTSISNIGSGVVLTGGNKWSDFTASDPIADITSGHAFIHDTTGMRANTLLLDYNTHKVVRRHPMLLDMYKYTSKGFLSDEDLLKCFDVDRLLIGNAIVNMAKEGQANSMVNIWGNNALLCYVDTAPPGLQTATFGLSFRWESSDLPAAFVARVYNDPDPGKKIEVTEVGYYQDEKIVARDLAYLVNGTL